MGDVIECSQLADRSRLIMVCEMSSFQTQDILYRSVNLYHSENKPDAIHKSSP